MANKNQIELANFIKSVHDELRKNTKLKGCDLAWNEHLNDLSNLEKYSTSMQELACLWEENSSNKRNVDGSKKQPQSRIQWINNEILKYFNQGVDEHRKKESHLLNIWYNESVPNVEKFVKKNKITILDVGSCYNPFNNIENYNITAIDLFPNKELNVFKCDFLQTNISNDNKIDVDPLKYEIKCLPIQHYDCIIFSLYLEYIPTSLQRISSCEKAYNLLKMDGILIIVTPDSEHVNKNAKLMKNWRYTLAKLGFLRIKFEKLNHLTCMVYRKACDSKISVKWSELHKENYMTFDLEIPQDKKF